MNDNPFSIDCSAGSTDLTVNLPLSAAVALVAMCLTLSAIVAGLTLALMALDVTELETMIATRSRGWRDAKAILPLRKRGNVLLSTLLLVNVAVNALLSIVLSELLHGLTAFLVSTALILLFAEILPQSIFSRHSLSVGARLIHLVWLLVLLTSPVTVPLGRCLDWLLGQESGRSWSRAEIAHLLQRQHALSADAATLVSGVVDVGHRRVRDVCTPMARLFAFAATDVLDDDARRRALASGFSRIPVVDHRGAAPQIIGFVCVRELLMHADAAARTALSWCATRSPAVTRVAADAPLDALLRIFKRTHYPMAVVVDAARQADEGVATLADLLRALIGVSLHDESSFVHASDAAPKQPPSARALDAATRAAVCTHLRTSEAALFGIDVLSDFVLDQLVSAADVLAVAPSRVTAGKRRHLLVCGRAVEHALVVVAGRVLIEEAAEAVAEDAPSMASSADEAPPPSASLVARFTRDSPPPYTSLAMRALQDASYTCPINAIVTEPCTVLRLSRQQYHAAVVSSRAQKTGANLATLQLAVSVNYFP